MTSGIVTGPDVIKPLLFIVIVVHDVIIEPCGCQGVTMALILWAVIWYVPIDPAISIIRRLELDQELHLRTIMKLEQIISLLEFCLKTTYFKFQGRFLEQLQGAAVGSPISPIAASLYMEDFETKAINTVEYPPKMWKRYVDDTCVVIDSAKKDSWTWSILTDPCIQFTTENAKADGSIPFLDTIVIHFPSHLMKPMLKTWQKLVSLQIIYSVIENLDLSVVYRKEICLQNKEYISGTDEKVWIWLSHT